MLATIQSRILFLLVCCQKLKLNSVSLFRERTVPTEQLSLVRVVNANFLQIEVSRGQLNGFPWSLISIF
jgi:hypothetical protein